VNDFTAIQVWLDGPLVWSQKNKQRRLGI